MSTLTGYVEHIVYRNEENGYTVMELSDKGKEYTVEVHWYQEPSVGRVEVKYKKEL